MQVFCCLDNSSVKTNRNLKAAFCFLFAIVAHVTKWRKIGLKTPSVATPQAKFGNAARGNCNRRTRGLDFHHVEFIETPRQNVCKNVLKSPFL